jgi:sulfonate transport system ATP-binding protein
MNLQEEMLKIWKKEGITMIIVTHDIDEAIYLGGKVVVMSPRPGRIKKVQTVDLGVPRRRTGPQFSQAREEIYREFFKEAEAPIEYYI